MNESDSPQTQDPVRTWRALFTTILVVCAIGFLCGVGMLHGDLFGALIGLLMTFVLASVCLFAAGYSIWHVRRIGCLRLILSVVVPIGSWFGVLYMVDHYPMFAHRAYFQRHRQEYKEAVQWAKAAAGDSVAKDVQLPGRWRQLSIDGKVTVSHDKAGRQWFSFVGGNGFRTDGPVLYYTASTKPLKEDEFLQGEILAPGWHLGNPFSD